MNPDKASFLIGELRREMATYPTSDAQRAAEPLIAEIDRNGDLAYVNAAIASFMTGSVQQESYDHELAHEVALDGRGEPNFTASDIPESVLSPARRNEFERAVRDGGMDAAARIIGIGQLQKLRMLARKLSDTLNG